MAKMCVDQQRTDVNVGELTAEWVLKNDGVCGSVV
jgi:hypothetical protein